MASIDDIEHDLMARSAGASVEDLGKIATALKDVADAKCAELTARNKGREVRLELFKSLAAFLVPVVSLAALFGTIISQNQQLAASRQQVEDTEWRDLLASLKGASDSVYSDPTVAPRLRSFFGSSVYGDQAKSIAGRLMGHISNPDGFRDLFGAVFGAIDRQNIDSILDIGRALDISRQSLHGQCNTLLADAGIAYDPVLLDCGAYAPGTAVTETMAKMKVPAKFGSLRQSDGEIISESVFYNARLTAFLRADYHIPRDRAAHPALDLSGENIVLADFSDLDLTDFHIAGTIFDTVTFAGATLAPKGRTGETPQDSDQPDFRGSTWWDARFIEPSLLSFLIRWYYPYLRPDTRYPAGYTITQQAYQAKVTALCAAANMVCPLPLPFGKP